jgi:hypothetical protein
LSLDREKNFAANTLKECEKNGIILLAVRKIGTILFGSWKEGAGDPTQTQKIRVEIDSFTGYFIFGRRIN